MNRIVVVAFTIALATTTAWAQVLVVSVNSAGGVAAEFDGDGVVEFADPSGVWRSYVSVNATMGVGIMQEREEAPDLLVSESCGLGTLYQPVSPPPAVPPPPLGGGPGEPIPFIACPFGTMPPELVLNGQRVRFGWCVVTPSEDGYSIGLWRLPDHDLSEAVNVPDIFAMLGDWFAGNARADYNRDGAVTVPDIFTFLSAWFAGE
jgi:hypothetical protein